MIIVDGNREPAEAVHGHAVAVLDSLAVAHPEMISLGPSKPNRRSSWQVVQP